ncbi:threonine/serine dehydratase [Aquicoccus sp. G2-2]|uniref:threonine ammonia-lyase n=1 Tax=Aquicoccus sp. G2-2 TaxID=3092120 RepID=UPI002ADFE305|nr:threonine/serine dehydratase [Aquicoccus sp. G2-2]MEA1114311.1 threonine/serine dehydratase [Aquicoccus sp. G2-2]
MNPYPVALDDIRAGQIKLADVVVRTPVLENAEVNAMLGGRLLLKAENFQRTGAFKIRGAYNRISNLTPDERACGVVSYSSGNHALGLARAAALLGTSAVIVMPSDVPAAKMAATRDLGAEIVTFDRDTENSAGVVARIIAETSRIEVPPSAHGQVLAGAGTAALELLEDAPALDAVLVPCGGGGLTAATAVVMAQASPQTEVFAAEPELFDDTRRSLAAAERIGNPKGQRTICDAIMTPIPNDVTFPINLDLLAGGVTASDEDVRTAMRFAFEHFKIVTEPGAVVGLAAILNGQVDIRNKTIATVITGGNIDAARFNALLGDDNDT